MSRMEALVRTLYARSFKGDAKSTSALMALVRNCGLGGPDDAPSDDFLSGDEFKRIADDSLARNGASSTAAGKSPTLPEKDGEPSK